MDVLGAPFHHQSMISAYNHERVRDYIEKHACSPAYVREKEIANALSMSRRCAGEHKRAVLAEMERWG